MTKTIKIPEKVHQELKRYAADNPSEKMESVAGYSIMLYLKAKGHKFSVPTKKQLPKPKK